MKRLFTLTVSLLFLLAALPVVLASAADCSHVYASDCDEFCDLCGASRWFSGETVEYTDPTVVVDHVAGRRGETVDVKVKLKNNTGIHSGTVRLAYDTQVLTFVSCDIYPAPYPDDASYTHNKTEGTLRLYRSCDMWLGISGEIGGESFATIRFRINEDAALGTAALTILGAGFSDGTHNSVSFATADGGISVVDTVPHVYDHDCDADCNACGATRTIEHTYDNWCDADCNVCGATRVPEEHIYDNDNDMYCNVCGATKEIVEYTIANGEVTITGACYNCPWILEIPSEIEGYPVTAIADYAFEGWWKSSVIIPDSVVSIGKYVFDLSSVSSVTLGSGITSIGEGAFAGSRLKSIVLPEGVTRIEKSAFANCTSLTSVTFSNSVAMIGANAFEACTALTDVYYDGTRLDRTKLTIAKGNDLLSAATWHYSDGTDGIITPGDANADGKINVRDLGLLQQYLNGWEVDIVEDTMDVNDDGVLSVKDLALLQRYLNGWDIELI